MKNKLKKPSVKSVAPETFAQTMLHLPVRALIQALTHVLSCAICAPFVLLRQAALLAIVLAIVLATSSTVWAKKVEYRKSQDVNFDAVDVDGTVRNPDGAYLAQKRGIDFMPLYKVRKNFDDSIKESVEYVK